MKTYKPKELAELGLLYGKPALVTIYKMLWDGRLNFVDTLTPNRSYIHIREAQVNEYNLLAEKGKVPVAKQRPVKQPKNAVS